MKDYKRCLGMPAVLMEGDATDVGISELCLCGRGEGCLAMMIQQGGVGQRGGW